MKYRIFLLALLFAVFLAACSAASSKENLNTNAIARDTDVLILNGAEVLITDENSAMEKYYCNV